MVDGQVGVRGNLAVKRADQVEEYVHELAQNRRPATAVNPVPDLQETRKLATDTIVLVRM